MSTNSQQSKVEKGADTPALSVAVIGGGAAGFFAAIAAAENFPQHQITIFEKSPKLLSKVKVSGGGRCNVTNGSTSIKKLSEAYPRGEKAMKKAFRTFHTKHTMEWFESRGVPLMIQEDNCVFPEAQDSQAVIDCFMRQVKRYGIQIKTGMGVKALHPVGDQIELKFIKSIATPKKFDKVIVASGGSPKRSGLEWLEALGHKIEDPVPSLFTFNMPDEPIRKLMGIVVEHTIVNIQGFKLKGDGPLLITHWGMSGPAILKMSAFGARWMSEQSYQFKIHVNWVNDGNEQAVLETLNDIVEAHPNKILGNYRPNLLPERLWHYLVEKAGYPLQKKWSELGKKGLNKFVRLLTKDEYQVRGKTTFKEEFVTCGGVSLESVDLSKMESKFCKNLFFAGEVMDIDGITGGYNFQSAWTTGFIAGKLGEV